MTRSRRKRRKFSDLKERKEKSFARFPFTLIRAELFEKNGCVSKANTSTQIAQFAETEEKRLGAATLFTFAPPPPLSKCQSKQKMLFA